MNGSEQTAGISSTSGKREAWGAPELLDLEGGLEAVRNDIGIFTDALLVLEES